MADQPNFPNKSNKKYFFHSIRQTCLISNDFYNKIILKRKDLTVTPRQLWLRNLCKIVYFDRE